MTRMVKDDTGKDVTSTHGYDVDTDTCKCGAEIQYFEDVPRPSHGCERAGPLYSGKLERLNGRLKPQGRHVATTPYYD